MSWPYFFQDELIIRIKVQLHKSRTRGNGENQTGRAARVTDRQGLGSDQGCVSRSIEKIAE